MKKKFGQMTFFGSRDPQMRGILAQKCKKYVDYDTITASKCSETAHFYVFKINKACFDNIKSSFQVKTCFSMD